MVASDPHRDVTRTAPTPAILALALAIVTLATPRIAHAHQASSAYVSVMVDGRDVSLDVRLASEDLGEPSGLSPLVVPTRVQFEHRTARASEYVRARFRVRLGDVDCPLASAGSRIAMRAEAADRFDVTFALRARCNRQIDSLSLRDELFFDIDPRHQALVSVRAFGGTQSHVLNSGRRDLIIAGTPSRFAQAREYAVLGVEHILTGYDHLAFLLALLVLAATRPRREGIAQVLAVVTAFTVAHSITLALAVTGVVRLPSRVVESAIAASIAWVALENVLRPTVRARWPVTFAFGLVHGLGFASALAETGLPSRGTALALVSFNVGVEVGQLAVVALVFPLLRLLHGDAPLPPDPAFPSEREREREREREPARTLPIALLTLATVALLLLGGASPRVVIALASVSVPALTFATRRVGYTCAVQQGLSLVIALFAFFWLVERIAGRVWFGGWLG